MSHCCLIISSGVPWPKDFEKSTDEEKIDLFDCRLQHWYIVDYH